MRRAGPRIGVERQLLACGALDDPGHLHEVWCELGALGLGGGDVQVDGGLGVDDEYAIAAGQRGYFASGPDNCAKAGTIAVTIVAGPLNYVGVNPKVTGCTVPEPSK